MKKNSFRLVLAVSAFILIPGLAAAQTSSSWNDQALGLNSSNTAAGNAASANSCSNTVEQRIQQGEQQFVAGQNNMATHYLTQLPAGGFAAQNCLNQLMGGINILFSPPNLNLQQILGDIVNQVCSMGQSMESQALAPISQSLSTGIPSYQIAPGISTGSAMGGVSIMPQTGTGTTGASLQVGAANGMGPVNVNIAPSFDQSGLAPTSNFSNGLIP